MAAILNPTSHSLRTERMRSTTNTAESAAESTESTPAVAPWNRMPARSGSGAGDHFGPVRHLRLVTDPVLVAPPARRPLRTLLAGLGLALLVAFAAVGVLPFLGADAAASSPASPTDATSPAVVDAADASAPAVAPVADPAPTVSGPTEIIVQQGDSLWTIARRLQPRGDLRRLVDRLIERTGGTSVTRGQRIDVRGLID